MIIGTMLWGTMTSESEAHKMMDIAIERGHNTFDCAQSYPKYGPKNKGESERIIGRYGSRDSYKVITKLDPDCKVSDIRSAVEESLKNLNTDYIDIFHIHEPSRGCYAFRQNWDYDATKLDECWLAGQLHELTQLKLEGKIKHIGLSNETAWAITKYGYVIDYVQNEHNLLYRHNELDVAEACVQENVKFQAWSPLAFGMLANGRNGERIKETDNLKRRLTPEAEAAAFEYEGIAEMYDMSLPQFAVNWVLNRPFVDDVVIGARTIDQLEELFEPVDWDEDSIKWDVEKVYKRIPMPF